MQSGTYKPAIIEDTEHQDTIEETSDHEETTEGIELKSITDDEQEDRVLSPISRPSTPPPKPLPKIAKVPAYLDHRSVSRFTPTVNNSCIINQEDETYLFIGLQKGEHVLFMGQVSVAPLFGSISIAGATLSSGRPIPYTSPTDELPVSFYPVFSPRTHSLLSIASVPLETASIQSDHDIEELDDCLLQAVFEELKDMTLFEAVVVIKSLERSGLDQMQEAMGTFNKSLTQLTRKEYKKKSQAVHLLPGFQPILEPTAGVKALQIESSWSSRVDVSLTAATERQGPVVSVVCGAKDMGKSSFSRYLINRLLSKYKHVAYLEADVGQSEFTPSGLLSLHYLQQPILGPPYTHQHLQPERSFFFGASSPRSHPDYYLDCLSSLVDHWRADQERVRDQQAESSWIPLVVNTQGWISGVGYHLLLSQIQKIEPTDIFAMRHPMYDYKNLPSTFAMDVMPVSTEAFKVAKEPAVLHQLDCVLQDATVVTLADAFSSIQQREMALASYFYQTEMDSMVPQWKFSSPLIARVPWMVDWRQSLQAIWVIHEEVKLNELFYALNGSLVGLLGHLDPPAKTSPNLEAFTPPNYRNTQEHPLPSCQEMTCYGLGIIRAIDPAQHALLILTPLPLKTLEKVTMIMKGELQLPLWAMLDRQLEKNSGVANVPWAKVPYITKESTEGAGANALRVRRNLLRRSQA
ncbi:Pre-mRNA cleavage complex II protein Clp1-domain-containing protein [Choanephora cucurbitarum]|nr:Pre-mRNA cleavage complex II protein Clp1-domain-containing protein [Choanephora cucurbitarum]